MKVSVYLKKCSPEASNICFRVRDKNVDIKVVSPLEVQDKYWESDTLSYRRTTAVPAAEQKRLPEQIASIIERAEKTFSDKADSRWMRQVIEDVLYPARAFERNHPNLLARVHEYLEKFDGAERTKEHIVRFERKMSRYHDYRREILGEADFTLFVGDLYRLTRDNIKDGFLEYMPQKTKKCQAKTVRVPLHEKALKILERYDANADRLFPFRQIHTYNLGIRELLKRCGINRMVTILDTHGYNTVQKPLYEVASSHTARKTFVGNLYRQVPDPNLIASMSGHVEGSRAFSRYRTIDDDMKRRLVEMID